MGVLEAAAPDILTGGAHTPARPVLTDSTPLHRLIARHIAANGPMSVSHYMGLCLGHPEYGYYQRKDPFGTAGDFTTAPEISQMFGELIGAWVAEIWEGIGQPDPFVLLEMGPGRGTLMADLLRITRKVPGFHQALRLHMLETSECLKTPQRRAVEAFGVRPAHVDRLCDLPELAVIAVANEFFDALPIRQFEYCEQGWRERLVAVRRDGDMLGWTLAKASALPASVLPGTPVPGDVYELNAPAIALAGELGHRLARQGGALLAIDYGHDGAGYGDSLQAVRRHEPVPVLDRPGQADLTAHVNFAALAQALQQAGATLYPLVRQGAFLTRMGLGERAGMLRSKATQAQREDISTAVHRLASPETMGSLFKVLMATGPDQPLPPGLDEVNR